MHRKFHTETEKKSKSIHGKIVTCFFVLLYIFVVEVGYTTEEKREGLNIQSDYMQDKRHFFK